MVKEKKLQDFNYHTHTYRCGHAKSFSDEEYVKSAIASKIHSLGFSDHIPKQELEIPNPSIRMDITDVSEYLASIERLKSKYKDKIEIISGFEVEFDPKKLGFLCELKEKVDYFILGQHIVDGNKMFLGKRERKGPNYPLQYAQLVSLAIESGLFDVIAHPDHYMQYRDDFKSSKEKDIFLHSSELASEMICKKAKEYGVVLELNYGGVCQDKKMRDGEYPYPHSSFWKQAAKFQNEVIFGLDAHNPKRLEEMEICKDKIAQNIDLTSLQILTEYHPVARRRENKILQSSYEKSKQKAQSFETEWIKGLLKRALEGENPTTRDDIFECLHEEMDLARTTYQKCLETKRLDIQRRLEIIAVDETEKERLERALRTCEKKAATELYDLAQQSITEAYKIGCNSQMEFLFTISKLIEEKKETLSYCQTAVNHPTTTQKTKRRTRTSNHNFTKKEG